MIKNVLTHIGGVENYGIISILLFFTVFSATLFWALRLSRHQLDAAARIPLDDAAPGAHSPTTNSLPANTHE